MKNQKTLKEQALEEIYEIYSEDNPVDKKYEADRKDFFDENIAPYIDLTIDKIEKEAQRRTAEEIERKMKPALDDFNTGGQKMIRAGLVKTGNEIIENVGYMRGIFYDLKSKSKKSLCPAGIHSDDVNCECSG